MRRHSPRTLTFLFADIRDYTAYVETHGDAAAHRLIADFRRMVRAQLALTGGGEIKTEGDSFYLVFDGATQAVRCGISILAQAAQHESEPLHVGVGIHAGEPVALDDQFIGSAVNLAARVGSAAQAGELLITDTVRGLLRTSGLPALEERAGLQLKGVADPPRVFSVDWRNTAFETSADVPVPRGWLSPRRAAVVATLVVAALVVGVVASALGRAAGPPIASPSSVGLPAHGAQLFDADLTPGGAARVFTAFKNTDDHIRFTGQAIRFEVTHASWAAFTVVNFSPDDFVGQFVVRLVSGDGSIALFFRGASGRQDQVLITPSTGEVTIQVARSVEGDDAPQHLFGPASRVPATLGTSIDIAVSARGRDIVVFLADKEIARATDTVIASGSLGVVVSASRTQDVIIELQALRLYNQ